MIINWHLVTYFIQRGTGDVIFSFLMKALDEHGISLKQVLTLSRDGPNVNKTIFSLFQNKLKNQNLKK